MIDRNQLSEKYARGSGLEIGAYHNPFPFSKSRASMTYVDKRSYDDLIKMRNEDPNLSNFLNVAPVDIVDCGETLGLIADNTYDFVVSSHQLEHCFCPITALLNQMRVIKPGGVGIFILPNHNNPIDKNRQITTIGHLVDHYVKAPECPDRYDHFIEYLSIVDGLKDLELSKRAHECIDNHSDIHFHVFDQTLIVDMIQWSNDKDFKLELFSFEGHEIFFILRKL